ncbi:hypothetical protein EDB84DRAFT_1511022 [Lactarius hengduanensis]|nr:hypothetical protein EDB84DRAFT_1511022 [Lactarius hengduanensis]
MAQHSTLVAETYRIPRWRLHGQACCQACRSSSPPHGTIRGRRRALAQQGPRRPGERVEVEDGRVVQGLGDSIERGEPCHLRCGFWRLVGRISTWGPGEQIASEGDAERGRIRTAASLWKRRRLRAPRERSSLTAWSLTARVTSRRRQGDPQFAQLIVCAGGVYERVILDRNAEGILSWEEHIEGRSPPLKSMSSGHEKLGGTIERETHLRHLVVGSAVTDVT